MYTPEKRGFSSLIVYYVISENPFQLDYMCELVLWF